MVGTYLKKHKTIKNKFSNNQKIIFQDQAQTACFSADGEVLVVGMTSGKWMVLDSSTREVFGVFQDGVDPIQVLKESPCLILFAVGLTYNLGQEKSYRVAKFTKFL